MRIEFVSWTVLDQSIVESNGSFDGAVDGRDEFGVHDIWFWRTFQYPRFRSKIITSVNTIIWRNSIFPKSRKIELTISTRPKMSEVFSRKLVHCEAQLNIDVMPDIETMPGSHSLIGRERHLVNFSLSAPPRNKIQTFYHTACKSTFHSSNRNQLQYKVVEIGIHWKNQTGTLDNRCLKMRLETIFLSTKELPW